MENDTCHHSLTINVSSPVVSISMFTIGVVGNVIALVFLEISRRKVKKRKQFSLFHMMVTVLIVTDLTGTCMVSPVVQASYMAKRTLMGMGGGLKLCWYFGFCMTFYSLATLSLLFTMALDRCLSIGWPYLYKRRVSIRLGYIALFLIYVGCILFCIMPFFGFGDYVQYCPGTWCFIDMNPVRLEDQVYANLYATVLLVIITSVVLCNGFVVYNLLKMYHKRRDIRPSVVNRKSRRPSIVSEVQHLLLMVFMTLAFMICTLPLTIRVYMNSMDKQKQSHALDLLALRFFSFNSIINPWLFIILSPAVQRFVWGTLCKKSYSSKLFATQTDVCNNS